MHEGGVVQAPPAAGATGGEVAAVLVCHDGARWLPDALAALRGQTAAPTVVVAVDTGSTDSTADLLAEALGAGRLAAVVTTGRDTGFGAAVHRGLERAAQLLAAAPVWMWVLHDDCAPQPRCLESLLAAVDVSPSVGMVGPLCLDWDDPRVVVEAGLSTDASGQLQTGIGTDELDDGQFFQTTEVLAVSSAGVLVNVAAFDRLGGYDPALPLFGDDLDLGWRAQRSGKVVLCVPAARIRHARAARRGLRGLEALGDSLGAPLPAGRASVRYAERAHGLRTFLVNTSDVSYRLGLLRLTALALLRALGFLLLRNPTAARIEWRALRWALGRTADLPGARVSRAQVFTAGSDAVRGLLTSRLTRMRNLLRGGLAGLARRQVRAELALGRLPEGATALTGPPQPRTSATATAVGAVGAAPSRPSPAARLSEPTVTPPAPRRRLGAVAPPAGAVAALSAPTRRVAGLRRPVQQVTVAAGTAVGGRAPAPPSPFSRDPVVAAAAVRAEAERQDAPDRDPPSMGDRALVVVRVGGARIARQLVLSPVVVLTAALTVVSLLVQRARLGLQLSGGGLLPAPGGATDLLRSYAQEWHGSAGGTAAPAPALSGLLGVLALPLGGADHAVAVLLLAAMPLAGISAYLATRSAPIPAAWRAALAAAWALLPVGSAGVSQGRLDTVFTHVLLPLVLAGVVSVLRGAPAGGASARPSTWLATAAATSLALAVVGSAAPLVHLLVVVLVLVGFVVVRPASAAGTGVRRALALFAVVLLPVGLLVPWPAVVLTHPSVLLHGVGTPIPGSGVTRLQLATLAGSAPGPGGAAGVLLIVAVVTLAALGPTVRMLGGVAVAVLGGIVAVFVAAQRSVPIGGGAQAPGSTGPAVLFVAAGLFMVVLVGLTQVRAARWRKTRRHARRGSRRARGAALTGVVLLAVAGGAGSSVVGGAVRAQGAPALPGDLRADLGTRGALVLTAAVDGAPVRLSSAVLPQLGDDDLAPVAGVVRRLSGWSAAVIGDDVGAATAAVAEAAAAGVGAVVLPPGRRVAQPLLDSGLVSNAGTTTDGRGVLRVSLAAGGARLLEPALATAARTGAAPPRVDSGGTTTVPGGPPDVAVRVSAGPDGRLLVLAAEDEPGWVVAVDGKLVAVARAYGHLVGVAVPGSTSEVVVGRSTLLRSLLLLGQGAVLLFTLFLAVPPRRRDR